MQINLPPGTLDDVLTDLANTKKAQAQYNDITLYFVDVDFAPKTTNVGEAKTIIDTSDSEIIQSVKDEASSKGPNYIAIAREKDPREMFDKETITYVYSFTNEVPTWFDEIIDKKNRRAWVFEK